MSRRGCGMSQVNLFRIQEGREDSIRSLLQDNYRTVANLSQQGFDFKLLYQHSTGQQEVNWGWAFTLFEKPIEKMSVMPKGVILLNRVSAICPLYAISFGGAHFHLDQFADRNFGFDFACRVTVRKTRLTATVNNNSKKNKTISSFKGFDKLEINSGESYTKLKVTIDQGSAADLIDENVEVGTSLKVNLKEPSFENLAKLIDYIERVLRGSQKTRIPYFRLVTKSEDIASLDSRLKDDFQNEQSTITISEFDVIGTDEVFNRADSYILRCGRADQEVSTLDWPTLRQFFSEKHIENVDDMFATNVKFLVNGSSKVSKPIRSLIDYLNEDERALLIGGKWYRFNNDFVECLHESLSSLPVTSDPRYDLTTECYKTFLAEKYQSCRSEAEYSGLEEAEYRRKIGVRFYKEYAFNLMREREGFVLCDRKPVPLKDGDTIEVCDLRKDDAIYSVKRGNASSMLCYLVDQSELAIDLNSNRELPRSERPQKVVIWMILPRSERLPIRDSVLEWDKLGMLLFKIKIDAWAKNARLAGMNPEVWLNYEID